MIPSTEESAMIPPGEDNPVTHISSLNDLLIIPEPDRISMSLEEIGMSGSQSEEIGDDELPKAPAPGIPDASPDCRIILLMICGGGIEHDEIDAHPRMAFGERSPEGESIFPAIGDQSP